MTTYPFDLKRALAGDAVCTVQGDAICALVRMPTKEPKPLFGVGDGNVLQWREDGLFMTYGGRSELDLRMVTDGGPSVQDELIAALKACESFIRILYGSEHAITTMARDALAKAGAI